MRMVAIVATVIAVVGAPAVVRASCGDANADGSVSLSDAVQALRASAGLTSTCDAFRCDVNGSGEVTLSDGVGILQRVAEPRIWYPHAYRCPVPKSRHDLSDFTSFSLVRESGLGFCPPVDSVFRVTIVRQSADAYRLSLSVAREDTTGTAECLGMSPFDPPGCRVEVAQPDRMLTAAELERLREAFARVEVYEDPIPSCGPIVYEYCVLSTYEWDDFSTLDFQCAGRWLTFDTETELTQVLDSLIDAPAP